MDDVERPLTTGEGGPYGALAARPMPPGLAVILMPSLDALLAEAERIKGSPLTEGQVVRIRDKALVAVAPVDVVAATVQQRGYAEVDAANPWESWRRYEAPTVPHGIDRSSATRPGGDRQTRPVDACLQRYLARFGPKHRRNFVP